MIFTLNLFVDHKEHPSASAAINRKKKIFRLLDDNSVVLPIFTDRTHSVFCFIDKGLNTTVKIEQRLRKWSRYTSKYIITGETKTYTSVK